MEQNQSRFATMYNTLRNPIVLGAATLTLALGIESGLAHAQQQPAGEANTPAAQQPDFSPEHVAACQDAAINRVASSSIKYVPFKGTSNRYVKESVEVRALPDDCHGVVNTTIRVRERMGKPGHMNPNSSLKKVFEDDGSYSAWVIQRTKRAYRCGEYIQQVVQSQSQSVQGGTTRTKTITSGLSRAC